MTEAEVLARLKSVVAQFAGQIHTPELRAKVEGVIAEALREMLEPFETPRVVDLTTDADRRNGVMNFGLASSKSEDPLG